MAGVCATMRPMDQPPPPSDEYGSPSEVFEALEAFVAIKELRMWDAARKLTWDLRQYDGAECYRELFHEAVRLILGGNRRWPKHRVDFATFFYMTMRNIAGKWRKRHDARRQARIILACEATRVGEDGTSWNEAERSMSEPERPEDAIDYHRTVGALRRAVDGHVVRQRALEWMFYERDDKTLEEVSAESGHPLDALKAAVMWNRRWYKARRVAEVGRG